LAQHETAGQHAGPDRLLAARRDELRERRLLDRLRREPQVERLAVRLLELREAVEEQPLELAGEARLRVDEPRELQSDPRRDRRLVRAALARERDARRRAGDDEPRAGVRRVEEPFEAPADERVVQCPDREERLSMDLRREAELAEQQEQVHL